jgi:hypothetical protein
MTPGGRQAAHSRLNSFTHDSSRTLLAQEAACSVDYFIATLRHVFVVTTGAQRLLC